jgi:hypothetical protein
LITRILGLLEHFSGPFNFELIKFYYTTHPSVFGWLNTIKVFVCIRYPYTINANNIRTSIIILDVLCNMCMSNVKRLNARDCVFRMKKTKKKKKKKTLPSSIFFAMERKAFNDNPIFFIAFQLPLYKSKFIITRGRGCQRMLEYTATRIPGTWVKNIWKLVHLIPVYIRVFIYYHPYILHINSKCICYLNINIYNNMILYTECFRNGWWH